MDDIVIETCQICGNKYQLGYTGAVDGCDECLEIERDRNGIAWFPDEQEHTYQPVDGSPEFTVARAEAFAGGAA